MPLCFPQGAKWVWARRQSLPLPSSLPQGGGLIDDPQQLARMGPDELGREFRFSQKVESAAQNGVLLFPRHHEHTAAGVVENGQRQGKAVGVPAAHILIDDDAFPFFQSLLAGEKRSGVPVRAQAEQDAVEAGKFAGRETFLFIR